MANEGKDETSGYLHNLTDPEKEALEAMKKLFANETCPEIEKKIGTFRLDDYTFLRFLRARHFHVDDAKTLLLNHLEWRRTFVPAAITPLDVRKGLLLGSWKLAGKTKEGRSLIVIDVGKFDPSVFSDVSDYVRLVAYFCEASIAAMDSSKVGLEKQCVVFDMGGWSLMKHGGPWGMKLTNALVSTVQDHYPERLWKCIVFNPPTVFSLAWKVIRPWLDKKTQDKVVFAKSTKDLLELIEADQLLVKYGGTRTEEYVTTGADQLLDGA